MSFEDNIYPLLKKYEKSPQWLKSIVGGIYATMPKSWVRGLDYERFRIVLANQNPEYLANYVKNQLAENLCWAVANVPAYRNFVDHETCRFQPEIALLSMPITSKSQIKANAGFYLSENTKKNLRLQTFTGGSTAEPMCFYLQKGLTRAKEYAFMENFHLRGGLSERDVVLTLRGRTVPTAAKYGGRLWMYEPIRRHLVLSSDHLVPKYMNDYMAVLRKWRPSFIQAFPSAIYPLACWLDINKEYEITKNIKCIFLYSENIYSYQLELLRKVFSCPVIMHYGHSERVLMAASMPDDDRYFFWPQYGFVELVDERGNSINEPNVIGEIVGTSFDNLVMPFVRYRTGDMAIWSDKPEHPALPGYRAVERIEGRLQEFIVCRDNRLISICTLGAAHFDEMAKFEAIQYEQLVKGHLILKVVTQIVLNENVIAKIQRAVIDKTQGGCTVEIMKVPEIFSTPRGKHLMLKQHLNISDYLNLYKDEAIF